MYVIFIFGFLFISFVVPLCSLTKTFLLIDGTEGFHSWDDGAMQMLGDLKIPFAVSFYFSISGK